jgi:hypothetical protein
MTQVAEQAVKAVAVAQQAAPVLVALVRVVVARHRHLLHE